MKLKDCFIKTVKWYVDNKNWREPTIRKEIDKQNFYWNLYYYNFKFSEKLFFDLFLSLTIDPIKAKASGYVGIIFLSLL